MSNIQDKSLGYSILKRVVMFLFRIYYKKITIIGKENIPNNNSPVIFTPVHQNALMDALAVHYITKKQIVFMMRGDAFSNKKIASFLRFIKIMPIFRMREGYESLGKNEKYFEQAVDTLIDNKFLGIMPEGNQREQRRMRPLVKGVFRIAIKAQQLLDSERNVKIVPVGLDYESYNHSGFNLLINVGKPIEVIKYKELYDVDKVSAMNSMKLELYDELKSLIVNIDDEKNYERNYLALLIEIKKMQKNNQLDTNYENIFKAKQKIANTINSMNEIELSDELKNSIELSNEYLKTEKNPKNALFLYTNTNYILILKRLFCLIFLIPAFVVTGLPYCLIKRFAKLKFSNNGFVSSSSFILGFLLYPIYWMVLFLLFGFIYNFIISALLFLIISPILAILLVRCKFSYKIINKSLFV